jgi:hypothetical protein
MAQTHTLTVKQYCCFNFQSASPKNLAVLFAPSVLQPSVGCRLYSRSVGLHRGCTSNLTVRLLPLPSSPWFGDALGDILRYLGSPSERGRMRAWPSPPVGNAENPAADVVGLTSFPFSLVLRWRVEEAEGLTWAPVVTRLWWLQLV